MKKSMLILALFAVLPADIYAQSYSASVKLVREGGKEKVTTADFRFLIEKDETVTVSKQSRNSKAQISVYFSKLKDKVLTVDIEISDVEKKNSEFPTVVHFRTRVNIQVGSTTDLAGTRPGRSVLFTVTEAGKE